MNERAPHDRAKGHARGEGLCVSYGKVEALTTSASPVGEGEIVTVIGPNGAGKTTLLSALMGLLPARAATSSTMGQRQSERRSRALVRGMTLVPEKRELFGEMSVEDNLLLGAFQRYRTGHRDHARRWTRSSTSSRACSSAAPSWPARCRAASARCWPWAAR
jgi:ABC-type branched-subunit amino acid transport system ATPase component